MQDFRKLTVWGKAHLLTVSAYRATSTFPREETYGLTSQIRRASLSIPANIAEGCGRGSGPDLARFLQISLGSASELQYHLFLAKELEFLNAGQYEALDDQLGQVKRMLTALLKKARV